jgi:UDP-N-acetylglucosamine 1-carboxyvinyltransferase
METIIIEGGHPLYGRVQISGAKNAALPILAATLLAPGTHTIHNVPDLRDTRTMLRLLETLGARHSREGTTVRVDTTNLTGAEAPYDLVKTMRASVLVLGPLLARAGYARVSLPGGCAIGARPINYHLRGFNGLGVTTHLTSGYVEARCEKQEKLVGATIYFDLPTVTGTENLLMASVMASGTTVIKNAAREPEVGNLIDMLNGMGAEIEGRDTDRLTVHGVDRLKPATITIIPDRIETGTYLIAVAATGGEVRIENCRPDHLPALTEKLRAAGITVEEEENAFVVSCAEQRADNQCRLRGVDVKTLVYPGFPTDLQAQFMALMIQAEGTSIIHETIFENRFMHVAELQRLGADITIDGSSAIVRGRPLEELCGAPVMATDLRASASLVIAGLAARGTTEISRIYHLERGYENMDEKLRALGAVISRGTSSVV